MTTVKDHKAEGELIYDEIVLVVDFSKSDLERHRNSEELLSRSQQSLTCTISRWWERRLVAVDTVVLTQLRIFTRWERRCRVSDVVLSPCPWIYSSKLRFAVALASSDIILYFPAYWVSHCLTVLRLAPPFLTLSFTGESWESPWKQEEKQSK